MSHKTYTVQSQYRNHLPNAIDVPFWGLEGVYGAWMVMQSSWQNSALQDFYFYCILVIVGALYSLPLLLLYWIFPSWD